MVGCKACITSHNQQRMLWKKDAPKETSRRWLDVPKFAQTIYKTLISVTYGHWTQTFTIIPAPITSPPISQIKHSLQKDQHLIIASRHLCKLCYYYNFLRSRNPSSNTGPVGPKLSKSSRRIKMSWFESKDDRRGRQHSIEVASPCIHQLKILCVFVSQNGGR